MLEPIAAIITTANIVIPARIFRIATTVTPVGRDTGVTVAAAFACCAAASVTEVAVPQLGQNFEFGSIFAPQWVQYDPISANLYPQ